LVVEITFGGGDCGAETRCRDVEIGRSGKRPPVLVGEVFFSVGRDVGGRQRLLPPPEQQCLRVLMGPLFLRTLKRTWTLERSQPTHTVRPRCRLLVACAPCARARTHSRAPRRSHPQRARPPYEDSPPSPCAAPPPNHHAISAHRLSCVLRCFGERLAK
jgi:hypothetical protein